MCEKSSEREQFEVNNILEELLLVVTFPCSGTQYLAAT
jgi:hypothetical protein